jgi:hypothetical protein
MGDVVRVADFQKRDTVGVLRELLVRATRGEVLSLAFHAEMKDGRQKTGFTGKFKNNVEEALRVANRMSVTLNTIKDAQDAAALARTK